MDTYQQIHDFTSTGAERFAAFLAAHARPDVNAEACRMECLGVISAAAPLSWELGAFESATGKPSTFAAELADLIVESVTPTE